MIDSPALDVGAVARPGEAVRPRAVSGTRLTWWQHLVVFGGSLALVALFTYPLVLDPGHLLPHHKDPFMYAWTMVSNVHRLLTTPLEVFHGNTFYPHGNTIAHTDLLLTPTLFPAGPVYLLTGNPVLQYNVALLVWWALSGWAMYVLALRLLGSHAAAAIAAIGFTLCPFRTDFFLEFQMELAFPIPLALLCLFRFLETGRGRYVAGLAALLWVEALASMYYAIILGLCLGVVTGLHVLLRPRAWRGRRAGQLALGGLVLGLALVPFLVPYVQNYRELGLERKLDQPERAAADVLTYFETGPTRLYHFSPSGHIAETSLFMGFVALGLAAVGGLVSTTPGEPAPSPARQRARWLLTTAIGAVVAALIGVFSGGEALRAAGLRVPHAKPFFDVLLLLGLGRIVLEGWWAAKAEGGRSPLGDRELRWICLFLIAGFFVLSLGPVIHFGRRAFGRGLYASLYPYLIPLHAMRITSRIGVVVILGVSLLAGLGMKALTARLTRPWVRTAVPAGLAFLLLAEYAPFPLPYQRIDWNARPPVYEALAADPADVAVLEWPQGFEYWDDYFTFMSISHWKRLVNGASGFSPMGPKMTRDISAALSRPDRPDAPFPGAWARRYLLGIHPLRYVVVHNALLDPAEQAKWAKLRAQPWATYLGRYGADDLYRLTGDETGTEIDKFFSWDYASTRPTIRFRARPVDPSLPDGQVEVALNGHVLGRWPLGNGWTTITMPLGGPLSHSAPNTLTLRRRYRPMARERRRLGRTGAVSPVDLAVTSAGMGVGNVASILVDGLERAPNHRGYNVVAIQPGTGRVLWADAFDTFAPAVPESRRLAQALDRLPPGTIVAVAVRDEASRSLTGEAVAALRSIGAAGDLRGQYRASHLVIGSKGAPPGTAIERVDRTRLSVTVGTPPDRAAIEVRDFRLE